MGDGGHAMADDPIDRTRLPIADPQFTGVANRTLEGSDWGLIGPVAPPEGAPDESVHHRHVAHGISG